MAALPLLPSALLLLGTQFVAVQTQRDEYNPDTHLSTVSAACRTDVASQIASIVDKRYQLDATIMIYYQKLSLHVSSIYMPIFSSTGCMLLHMVFSTVKENSVLISFPTSH